VTGSAHGTGGYVSALRDKHVLVTGGAGFIGSHLVDAVASASPGSLTVVDSFFLGKPQNLDEARAVFPELSVYRLDASDIGALSAVFDETRTQVVFDLATAPLPYSLEEPRRTIDQNIGMAAALCELSRLGAYETLVHFSSSEVYGTAKDLPMAEDHPMVPLTPYAASKAGADHIVQSYVETFGIEAIIVRPFNNYGPRQNEGSYAGLVPIAIRAALAGEPVTIYGDGQQTRDFVYVTDTVAGSVRAYATPAARGSVVNLASGTETTVLEVVETIFDIIGSPLRLEHAEPRPGDVRRHLGSAERANRLFGFRTTTGLRAGMEATVEWYASLFAGRPG
jgi:UDP-glucose 4-epimerase